MWRSRLVRVFAFCVVLLGFTILRWVQHRSPTIASPAAQVASGGKGFSDRAHLQEHFEKHGREFGMISIEEYLERAQELRDRPAGGDVLEIVRADGMVTRFDRGSGAFEAFSRDGVIHTFFRPNDGEDYFHRQAERAH